VQKSVSKVLEEEPVSKRKTIRTCLAAASSTWKRLSRPRSLIACKSAVAIFICVSKQCFLAVSSGRAVMAVLRCAALLVKSLIDISTSQRPNVTMSRLDSAHICETSFISLTPVLLVISAASILYRLSSESMSSATAGNGMVAFLAQKKSFESKS
jgi:hypothetical protein